MATTAAESDSKPSPGDYPTEEKPITLEEAVCSWIEYGVHQAQHLQETIDDTVKSSIEASRSRFSEIVSTSSVHFQQTIESLKEVKSEYDAYAVGKIKEGILVAASNPLVTSGLCVGLGFLLLKRPRRFLYYNTLRRFISEESMVARAEAKLKELEKSIDSLKKDSVLFEKEALEAEDKMKRGRTKLRQTGSQIQGVISSSYKIERQARGLKDILGDLYSKDASKYCSEVSNIVSVAKRERRALSKKLSEISNYGISV